MALEDCGLREGLLMDYLATQPPPWPRARPRRARAKRGAASALRCVRRGPRTPGEGARARALRRGRGPDLHHLGERERELLGYAALLHDIGTFLSYRDHHLHTAYLVRNADLVGFDQEEIELLAAVTQFHRKALPGSREPGAGPPSRWSTAGSAPSCGWPSASTAVTAGVVGARCAADHESLRSSWATAGDCHLELWGIQTRQEAVEKALGRPLVVSRRAEAPDLVEVGALTAPAAA